MFDVITEHEFATKSFDYLYPHGSRQDNNTNPFFINEVLSYFNRNINVLDVGCAGGQMVIDFANRGCTAIGVDGSDYMLKRGLFNWGIYYKKHLFNCDISKPFYIIETTTKTKLHFDLITAWEVPEHLKLYELCTFFDNIRNNLKPDGLFVCSINFSVTNNPFHPGVNMHRTMFKEDFWRENIIPDYFEVVEYPFKNAVRGFNDPYSFLLGMKLKND